MIEYIVGLGNPGPSYVFTRHNVGFLFLDHLCSKKHCGEWRDMGSYLLNSAEIFDRELHLVKPTTFMNLSGRAVLDLTRRDLIASDDLIVVHDDVAIPLGRFRIRRSGSDGGHNGMKSVINALGTKDIPRIRIGIGPKREDMSLVDYVLSEFSDDEFARIHRVFDVVIEALEVIIEDGIEKAMSLYNSIEVI